MKKLTLILLITLNLQLVTVFAQQTTIDSLKQVIATAKQDTNQVKILLKLGDQYRYTTPDTALYYYRKALDIAKDINALKFEAKCSNYIATIHLSQSNFPKATE